MSRHLVFTCLKCGSHKIEEIMVDMTVASEISISEYDADDTGPGGISTEYREQTNEGGHIDRYQCGGCGYTIVDDNSPHSELGLDERALAKAIEYLNANAPAKDVPLITHAELVERFADAVNVSEGECLEKLWNDSSPNQVKYIGDSMFEWVQE